MRTNNLDNTKRTKKTNKKHMLWQKYVQFENNYIGIGYVKEVEHHLGKQIGYSCF